MRRRNTIDVSKLTAKEAKSYRKRLAQVRTYTRQKRLYEKQVKMGLISPKFTFEMYRKALAKGEALPAITDFEADLKWMKETANSKLEKAAAEKMERLMRGFKELKFAKLDFEKADHRMKELLQDISRDIEEK